MKKFLYKLERLVRPIAISNLMLYICGTMLLVFALDFVLPSIGVQDYLYLNRNLLFQGQVWRLVTYLFLPPESSPIFIIFALYFYYMIGVNLEKQWGAAKFTLYYLIGMLGTTIAALITGYGTNTYLNLSLFFAFAIIFPNYEVLLFFVLPVKVKYLAYIDAAFFVISIVWAAIGQQWYQVAAILASVLNFFLFFGGDFFRRIKEERGYSATRRNFRRQMKNNRW